MYRKNSKEMAGTDGLLTEKQGNKRERGRPALLKIRDEVKVMSQKKIRDRGKKIKVYYIGKNADQDEFYLMEPFWDKKRKV